MPELTVETKSVPALLVASKRLTIPTNDQAPDLLGAAFRDVVSFVHARSATPTAPHMTLWHSPPDVYENEDVEVLVPIANRVEGHDDIRVYDLEEALVAYAVHRGPFSDFTAAHHAILAWITANGHHVAGPYREIYIRHDPNRRDDTITEVQIPIRGSHNHSPRSMR